MSEEAIQDTGSQEAVAAEAAPVSFLETLNEEYRDVPSMQKFTDVNGMAKSYINLEQMVGADKIAIPGKSATPDEWREVYNRLGSPTDPKDYSVEVPEGILQEGENEAFRNALYEAGLNNSQAQKMSDFMSGIVDSAQQRFEQSADEARYNSEQELRQEYGQAFDQKLELARGAATTLLGGTEMFDEIQLADGRMLGDEPRIIKMFAELAAQIGEDNIVGETNELIMTPDEAKNEALKLMAEKPYQEKSHPQHDFYVQEVNRLFNLGS